MKRRIWRKHLALALSLCVTLSATVQSTFGFLTTRSQQIENTFQPQQLVEGDLILLKTIEHPFGENYRVPENLSFDFKVELGSHYALTTLETTEGTVITDENGTLLVSLQPDAPIGINGIDEGTEVTVTELAAMPKGFAPKDELTQTVTVSPDGNTTAEFVNVYTPAPVRPMITVGGTKILAGRDWQPDDRFTFLLEQQVGDDRVLLDVDTITEETAFGFDAAMQSLSFDTAGEYVFYISELDGSLADMTYDAAVYDFTVTVADADMDGSLEIASVTSENAAVTENEIAGSYDVSVSFTNAYTAPAPEDPGNVVYQIDDINGLPDTTVRVPVLAWYDEGTASVSMQFAVPEGFVISGYEFGNAYTGEENAIWSADDYSFTWTSPDGTDQIAESGAAILYLLVDVPADAQIGETYPVIFTENSVSVSDAEGNTPAFDTVDGSVFILEAPQPDPGHAVYQIDDVNGLAGTTVRVPVLAWFDDGAAALAMQFTVPEGFVISGYEQGDAYTGETVWSAEDYSFAWTSPDGAEQIAEAGSVILYLLVDVPADAAADTAYPIDFVEGSISVSDNSEEDVIFSTINGSVYVLDVPTVPAGNVVYNIGDTEATPGSKVDVPVDVWFDNGTASFSMTFDIPEGFTIDSITYGDGYEDNGTFTFDPENGTLVWTSNDGSNYVPTPGENIATITLTVPEDAEIGTEYPIGITEIIPVDENGNPLEYTVNEGTVSIIAPETTTTTTETTTTETTTTFPNPGNVVYNIGDTEATPGSKVDVPVDVWFDNGTASFSMTFDIPEGFTIDSITYGDGYEDNGTFTFDPENGTLVWTSNDGSNYVPTPGQNIAVLTIAVPEDAAAGDVYLISAADVVPQDAYGSLLTYVVNDGELTILAMETTTTPIPGYTTVTTYVTEFTPPTRVNYWSHDLRTFVESGGLDGLSALIHLYKYNVNADGCFVNADGTVVTDAEGNPMVYDAENPVFPEISDAFEYKWLDVTATTQPPADADSPVEVYEPGVHAYPIAVYYDQSKQTDPDFIFGDGSPMFFGEFNIFIGLKGDVTLDDAVDTRDAIEVLQYYNSVTIMGNTYEFHDDPYLHDLAFYLGDVYYTQTMNTVTAIAILQYYNRFTVIGEPVTWTDICGYDFPDEFFEGTEESVPEEEPAAEETESTDETDPADETTPVEEETPVTEAISVEEQPTETTADLMTEIQARLACVMAAQS